MLCPKAPSNKDIPLQRGLYALVGHSYIEANCLTDHCSKKAKDQSIGHLVAFNKNELLVLRRGHLFNLNSNLFGIMRKRQGRRGTMSERNRI